MISKQKFAQALASGDRSQLYELSRRLATDVFLDQGYQAYRSLTNGEKRSAEGIADIYEQDRLDGLLMLITEKRMPAQPCFGPSMLGSDVSDYDYARTFLLKNLRATGTPGLLKPTAALENFYPELNGGTVVERMMTMAVAHMDIPPYDDRQVNLVSCRGRYNYQESTHLTKPAGGGTTCAIYLRALLDAAGDRRIQRVPGAFSFRPDMTKCLGCNPDIGKYPKDNGWAAGGQIKRIARGNLYMARDNTKKDSGHVGIVKTATVSTESILLTTIDGGQGSPGHWLRQITNRKFVHSPTDDRNRPPWLQVWPGMANLERRLQGIVIIGG